MEFEKFKQMFDECFGKVTPKEFIQRMENLGYVFQEPEHENQRLGGRELEILSESMSKHSPKTPTIHKDGKVIELDNSAAIYKAILNRKME